MPDSIQGYEPQDGSHRGLFAGGGEMGGLMEKMDWSATPLGPPETWPHGLRTIVRILLTSRYAMWMGWGPELTFFYNDAYGAMTLGAKHPWALGRPSREVWAEIWPQIGPRIDHVLATGEATWDERLLLFLERSGYPEETYHTFSYSPLPDDEGRIRGNLCVVTEETERVIDERRLAVLADLGTQLAASKTEHEVFRALERGVAGDSRDLPFTLLYLFGEDRNATLVSLTGVDTPETVATLVPLDALASAWGLDADYQWDSLQVMPAPAFADWRAGSWDRRSTHVFVAPIRQQGQPRPAGVLIAGANPYRTIDEKYRSFITLFVGQLTAAVANARAYDEERRRAEALGAIDRAKTAFFSNVSHEFRTPLTLMLGPTEDALSTRDGALRGEDLRTVYRNEIRLLRLVNTLLDFSRIEAGRAQAFFEPVNLSELTADLAGVFRSAMERGGLRFEVDCDPSIEPVYVDRQMWEKIVLNLLSNAFKFTFEGEVRVTLRSEGGRVVLKVSDTGVGIPADQHPRIFERFHRIEGTRARTHEGSGIGLALVHDLVGLHGGIIGIDSEPGRGTTFTVTLTAGRAHLPADRIGPAPGASGTALDAAAFAAEAERWLPGMPSDSVMPGGNGAHGVDAMPPDADGPRILVVDDNADMRDYLTRMLRTRWTTDAVADGREALAAIRKRRPTLVLSDVMMPGLDGFGLLRALREDPATRGIPVIMLSARAGEESRIEGLEAGADDYLVKPFSARELMARVATRLDLHRLGTRLEQERLALTDLFRQSPVPVAVLRGPDLVFEIANAAYQDVVGNRDLLGKPLLQALPEFEGQGFDELLLEVMRTGVTSVGREEALHIERHGRLEETFWTFIYSPLAGAGGEPDRVVAICNDVTEQVRARRKLEALAAAAESANRAKDEFLAMLGHELRNPLAPILTALQLMHLKGVGHVEKERTIIERQTRHLVRLVDDLLDVSRIARGKIELKKERQEVAAVVARAIELASPLFESRGQRLEVDVPVTGLMVDADPSRLSQALANLLTNAAKYTERAGRVTIRAWTDDAEVFIAVRDDGIGIEPEMLPYVFDLFVQERQALDRSQGGLGLGLAIVRNIMTLHGGSATVSSGGQGQGSEFVLRLPAPSGSLDADGADVAPGHTAAEATGFPILVVDDNEDAAMLLAEFLSVKGHQVRVASDSPTALRTLSSFLPSVVVLDIGLPGMDGYELASLLRADSRYAALRLVAVTGYGQHTDRDRSLAAGFDAHLVKPVDIDHLDQVLREVLRSER